MDMVTLCISTDSTRFKVKCVGNSYQDWATSVGPRSRSHIVSLQLSIWLLTINGYESVCTWKTIRLMSSMDTKQPRLHSGRAMGNNMINSRHDVRCMQGRYNKNRMMKQRLHTVTRSFIPSRTSLASIAFDLPGPAMCHFPYATGRRRSDQQQPFRKVEDYCI